VQKLKFIIAVIVAVSSNT